MNTNYLLLTVLVLVHVFQEYTEHTNDSNSHAIHLVTSMLSNQPPAGSSAAFHCQALTTTSRWNSCLPPCVVVPNTLPCRTIRLPRRHGVSFTIGLCVFHQELELYSCNTQKLIFLRFGQYSVTAEMSRAQYKRASSNDDDDELLFYSSIRP
jgi:hypothetical protein